MPRSWTDGSGATGASLYLYGLSVWRSINSKLLLRFDGLFNRESNLNKSDVFQKSRSDGGLLVFVVCTSTELWVWCDCLCLGRRPLVV